MHHRTPWFQENQDFYRSLNHEVGEVYPELHFLIRNNTAFLRGSFPIREGKKTVDRFHIEVEFPPHYPKGIPVVFEIAGRIPRTADRHTYPSGEACLYFPLQLAEVVPEGTGLLDFLSGPVLSFFFSQTYFEQTGKWPFGEWPHGEKALFEFYSSILGINNQLVISQFLRVINKKEIKGHWPCPCGSGKLLRHCHFDIVSKLNRDYQYAMRQKNL